jgi:3D (Asp-Asp-Asp) domain-containing protein
MRNCSQKVSVGLMLIVIAATAHGARKRQNKEIETKVITKVIASPVRFETSRNVEAGRILRSQEGSPGSITRTYRILRKDGKPFGRELLTEHRTEPSPTIFLMGRAGHAFSRGAFVRHRVLNMRATSYYSNVTGTGRTRTGERAKFGVVAVDPRVIPLGTILFVEGYGMALACDTGGAIKGNRIDLCYGSLRQANGFRTHTVKVHVLN